MNLVKDRKMLHEEHSAGFIAHKIQEMNYTGASSYCATMGYILFDSQTALMNGTISGECDYYQPHYQLYGINEGDYIYIKMLDGRVLGVPVMYQKKKKLCSHPGEDLFADSDEGLDDWKGGESDDGDSSSDYTGSVSVQLINIMDVCM